MLREAWVKSRGAMANLNMSAHVAAQGMPGSLGGPSNTSIMYTEEWKVKSIEYRGWGVDKNAPALAGKHDVQVSLRREHAACWKAVRKLSSTNLVYFHHSCSHANWYPRSTAPWMLCR